VFNPFPLNKAERRKRLEYRCEHRHNGISHNKCYDRAYDVEEKIGFFDIETSNLSGDFGVILSYCILGNDNKLIKRIITPEEIKKGIFDKELTKQLCVDLRKFDRVIGYYSSRFDGPFCRTRCVFWGHDFPLFKEIRHTDAYMLIKHKFNLHSKRLGVVAPFFGIKAKGHPLNPEVWFRCMSGDKKALEFVGKHNEEDVNSLKQLWERIENFTKLQDSSL